VNDTKFGCSRKNTANIRGSQSKTSNIKRDHYQASDSQDIRTHSFKLILIVSKTKPYGFRKHVLNIKFKLYISLKGAEIKFMRATLAYQLVDHRRNEELKEELPILGINQELNTCYGLKWQRRPGRLEQTLSQFLSGNLSRARRGQERPQKY
jgi:hypothetical protein